MVPKCGKVGPVTLVALLVYMSQVQCTLWIITPRGFGVARIQASAPAVGRLELVVGQVVLLLWVVNIPVSIRPELAPIVLLAGGLVALALVASF